MIHDKEVYAIRINATRNGCTRTFIVDLTRHIKLDCARQEETPCTSWMSLCNDLARQDFAVDPKSIEREKAAKFIIKPQNPSTHETYAHYSKGDMQTIARHYTEMINDFETYLQQLPAVVRKFDGKVINKRFNDALIVANPITHNTDGKQPNIFRLTIGKSYNSKEYDRIDLYVREKYCNFGGFALRLDEHRIPTAQYVNDCGKRLNAAKFLEAVKELRDRMLTRVRTLQDMAANFDEYRARLEVARQAFIAATDGIPDELFTADIDSVVPRNLTLKRREAYEKQLMESV